MRFKTSNSIEAKTCKFSEQIRDTLQATALYCVTVRDLISLLLFAFRTERSLWINMLCLYYHTH